MKSTKENSYLIADSGFWVALANAHDHHHLLALEALDKFEDDVFIVTWPVITEASYLIRKYVGLASQLNFLNGIEQGGVEIFNLEHSRHLQRMQVLMRKYANLPMDLADASLLVLAEDLEHGRILSTDERDFNSYRWKNREPFENLLLT